MPGEADASPRVRAAFTDVRKRLLPEIRPTRYTAAKAAFDRKDYAAAEPKFRELLALLERSADGRPAADLRMLAIGFLDLSVAAAGAAAGAAQAGTNRRRPPAASAAARSDASGRHRRCRE